MRIFVKYLLLVFSIAWLSSCSNKNSDKIKPRFVSETPVSESTVFSVSSSIQPIPSVLKRGTTSFYLYYNLTATGVPETILVDYYISKNSTFESANDIKINTSSEYIYGYEFSSSGYSNYSDTYITPSTSRITFTGSAYVLMLVYKSSNKALLNTSNYPVTIQ